MYAFYYSYLMSDKIIPYISIAMIVRTFQHSEISLSGLSGLIHTAVWQALNLQYNVSHVTPSLEASYNIDYLNHFLHHYILTIVIITFKRNVEFMSPLKMDSLFLSCLMVSTPKLHQVSECDNHSA